MNVLATTLRELLYSFQFSNETPEAQKQLELWVAQRKNFYKYLLNE
jgi:hypothetical protein